MITSVATVYDYHPGSTPLLVSVPHDGREIPDTIAARMTAAGLAMPDTDRDVARLYEFCRDAGAHMIVARYSRYVIDLNRPQDDSALYPGQLATGLCPERTFAGEPIYAGGSGVDDAERRARVERYWRPYHERLRSCLDAIVNAHGCALLWDAHSIASEVPSLFDGTLPVLNVGTHGGESCAPAVEAAAAAVARDSGYEFVVNGRFTGGFITRRYGRPQARVHAVQLELAQRAYMDECRMRYDARKAARLIPVLRRMLAASLDAATEAAREQG